LGSVGVGVAVGVAVGEGVGVGDGVAVGDGVGVGEGVGVGLWHPAIAATTRNRASADARIDRPMIAPQNNLVGNDGIITHRSQNDGGTPRNVSVARLPVPESLCYSPAGDRPAQPCPGLARSPVSGQSNPVAGNRNTHRRGSPLAETCASIR
jgi:hypothetical protein